MISIFFDIVEETTEVFMDDFFFVVGDRFDKYLVNLENALRLCEECNLVLNLEKCHFMVKEVMVLGHKISKRGIKLDKAKIKVI